MTDLVGFSELEEIMRLALREQAIHPQGLNSSQIHGTLYPLGDARNKVSPTDKEPSLKEPAAGPADLCPQALVQGETGHRDTNIKAY
tara:strand:- start:361 stop:621 length:261 start_codon:yes stop_codon:yes gene_type:complete